MARGRKVEKRNVENLEGQDSLAFEIGRIGKLFALYLLRDVTDEAGKVTKLKAVGYSAPEIAALLDKSEANVRVQLSQSRKKKG